MQRQTQLAVVHWRYSLRSQLLLMFLGLALVPLAGVGGLAYWQSEAALRERTMTQMGLVAELEAANVNAWLSARLDNMQVVAGTARVRTMDVAKAGDAIQQYFDQWGLYQSMFLAGPDGQTLFVADGGAPVNLADRDYFQRAMRGETIISEPLISLFSHDLVVAVAAPVTVDGQVVGVVGGTLLTEKLSALLVSAQFGATGEAYLINAERYFISPSRFTEALKAEGLITERAEMELRVDTPAARAALAGQTGVATYPDYRRVLVMGAYAPVPLTGWGLLVEQDAAEALAAIATLRNLTLGAAGLATLAVAVLATLFARRIAGPLGTMLGALQNLARGDLNRGLAEAVRTRITGRRDEIGAVGRALRAAEQYFMAMADAAGRIADGDLTVTVAPQGETDELGQAFARMVTGLRRTVGQVAETATAVDGASSQLSAAAGQAGQATAQIAATMQQVAQGTQQQAAGITLTVSAVGELRHASEGVAAGAQQQAAAIAEAVSVTSGIVAAVQQVAGSAGAVSRDSGTAAAAARSGAERVTDTVQGMRTLREKVHASAAKVRVMSQRSEQIGAIVETIDEIAAQTNLLALNAAIEAARAGEHGKGFAVVADEVRKLAERASSATKEIGGLVRGIQVIAGEAAQAMDEGAQEAEQGVGRADAAGQALADILTTAEAVSAQAAMALQVTETMAAASTDLTRAMQRVSAVVDANARATRNMAAGSDEAVESIENIASISEENSAAVEEVSASAEEMAAQVEQVGGSAQALADLARSLTELVGRFQLPAPAAAAEPVRSAPAAPPRPSERQFMLN